MLAWLDIDETEIQDLHLDLGKPTKCSRNKDKYELVLMTLNIWSNKKDHKLLEDTLRVCVFKDKCNNYMIELR